jgi:hypothetical protein
MESPNSPRPEMESKVKSMFIIKGIVHKQFVLAGQGVNSAYCCDGDCVKCAKTSL